MIEKIWADSAQVVAAIQDGASVIIGGFGTAGMPDELIDTLIARGLAI
jgi:3-oxoadipate CoA-transferase alpha subunit